VSLGEREMLQAANTSLARVSGRDFRHHARLGLGEIEEGVSAPYRGKEHISGLRLFQP